MAFQKTICTYVANPIAKNGIQNCKSKKKLHKQQETINQAERRISNQIPVNEIIFTTNAQNSTWSSPEKRNKNPNLYIKDKGRAEDFTSYASVHR